MKYCKTGNFTKFKFFKFYHLEQSYNIKDVDPVCDGNDCTNQTWSGKYTHCAYGGSKQHVNLKSSIQLSDAKKMLKN